MITHELMRELLKDDLGQIHEIAEFVPNEIVYKALIIREFMAERGIEDPRQGIREFHAFERERLKQLGFVDVQDELGEPSQARTANEKASLELTIDDDDSGLGLAGTAVRITAGVGGVKRGQRAGPAVSTCEEIGRVNRKS
jgi:hypothetical protein